MRIDSQLPVALARPGGAQSTDAASKTGLSEREQKRLKEACKDFEALFLSSLMKSMRKTVQKTNLFGSDSGEATFQEMMDAEVSKAAAKTSSLGIADMMYRQAVKDISTQDESTLRQVQGAQELVGSTLQNQAATDAANRMGAGGSIEVDNND